MLFLAIVLSIFFLLALLGIVDSARRIADAMTLMAQCYQLGTFTSISDFDFASATAKLEAQITAAAAERKA